MKIAVISQAKKGIRKMKKKMDGSYKDRRENTTARGWRKEKKKKKQQAKE